MTVVIQYECNEAVLADVRDLQHGWTIMDDLGCEPSDVIPLEEVLVTDEWDKNGIHRVNYKRRCMECGSTDAVEHVTDPYREEILGDATLYWICAYCVWSSARDI